MSTGYQVGVKTLFQTIFAICKTGSPSMAEDKVRGWSGMGYSMPWARSVGWGGVPSPRMEGLSPQKLRFWGQGEVMRFGWKPLPTLRGSPLPQIWKSFFMMPPKLCGRFWNRNYGKICMKIIVQCFANAEVTPFAFSLKVYRSGYC